MPTSMLDQLRASISERLAERGKAHQEMMAVLTAPAAENRDLNEAETLAFAEHRDKVNELDQQIDNMQERVAELVELDRRTDEREKLSRELTPVADPRPVGTAAARVTHEDPTYRKGGKFSFFADAYAIRANMATPDVIERLNRHHNEVRLGDHGAEYRDVGTSAFGALVVPQYLPEMYAEVLRAGRVTANLATPHDLPPEGMTMTIPRGTSGTGVAAQTAENDAVSENDYDETDLVVNVRTYAGQQDVSRQAVERGRGIDEIIYADLAGAYAARLDRDILGGALVGLGTNGTHLSIFYTSGINSVATLTNNATSLIRNIADGIQQVNTNRFLPADTIVMHPRRWAFLSVASDSNGRPLVTPREDMPQNVWGVGEPAAYGLVGGIMGVPVYTDANVPTTNTSGTTASQDVIYIFRRGDLHLWEESVAPRQFRFEETLGGNLTIKLVIAGYSAFTAGHHPEGIAVLSGTALAAPGF